MFRCQVTRKTKQQRPMTAKQKCAGWLACWFVIKHDFYNQFSFIIFYKTRCRNLEGWPPMRVKLVDFFFFFLKQLIFLFFRECYTRIPTQTVVTETQPNKTKRKRQEGISKTRSYESHKMCHISPQNQNKLIFCINKWLLLGPLRFSFFFFFALCIFHDN